MDSYFKKYSHTSNKENHHHIPSPYAATSHDHDGDILDKLLDADANSFQDGTLFTRNKKDPIKIAFPDEVDLYDPTKKYDKKVIHILINRASTVTVCPDAKERQQVNLEVVLTVYGGVVNFYKIYNQIGKGDVWSEELLKIVELAKEHIVHIYALRLNRICRW